MALTSGSRGNGDRITFKRGLRDIILYCLMMDGTVLGRPSYICPGKRKLGSSIPEQSLEDKKL